MLHNYRKGYAVMSPDFKGISFEDENFETCKRYCFNGDVIVEVKPKKCGFSFRVRYHKKNPFFKFNKFEKVFFKCRLYIEWEWGHEYIEKVLYTNPYDYSESIKRRLVN